VTRIAPLPCRFRECVARSEPWVSPLCAISNRTRAAAVMQASVPGKKAHQCADVDEQSEHVHTADAASTCRGASLAGDSDEKAWTGINHECVTASRASFGQGLPCTAPSSRTESCPVEGK